jgi:hypothetical protein
MFSILYIIGGLGGELSFNFYKQDAQSGGRLGDPLGRGLR